MVEGAEAVRLTRHIAAGLKSLGFAGSGGAGYGGPWGWLNALLPGSQYDYRREAGNLWENSIILACLKWESDAFVEAPFHVEERVADGWQEIENHPLTNLIRNPNPVTPLTPGGMDWDETLLWTATKLSMSLDGNCYWYLDRNRLGQVAALQWLPHWMVEPQWPADGSVYIAQYCYRIGGKDIHIPRSDILHFRDGIDPRNHRKGLSRLSAVLREVCTDNERATFSAALMRNMGVPGCAISPDGEGAELPDGMAPSDIAKIWQAKYTGDRRGEPFVSEIPMKITAVGLSPEKMIMDKVSRIPEARICAAFQISPIVLGMEIGLDNSTYSNYDHALQATYMSNVLRSQKIACGPIQRKLLPEMGGNPQQERACFDNSETPALQDDRTALGALAAELFQAGVAKRWEAKHIAKLTYDETTDDVYFTDLAKPALPLPDLAAKGMTRLEREIGLLRNYSTANKDGRRR